MTTLKILWQAKQDMRRVQVAAVKQVLAAHDGRRIESNSDELSFRDLLDYVLLVFPEIDAARDDVLLYYTDDDEELVRITNDVELTEAFRLMRELAVASGRTEASAVCKMTLVTRPSASALSASSNISTAFSLDASSSSVCGVRAELVSQALEADQQKRMMALFVDLSKVVDAWEPAWEHEELKRDVVSLLHEPGCQDALIEIMANEKVRCPVCVSCATTDRGLSPWSVLCGSLKYATIFQRVSEEFQKVRCRTLARALALFYNRG